jgi:hypothetical protein
MGFRSGLWPGQSISGTSLSPNHSLIDLALWQGALSCSYRQSSLSYQSSIINSMYQVSMSLYPSAFRFPCSIMRGPSPFYEKHPHTVMPSPPYFTVGTTHAGRYRSPGIRHTQTLPSDRRMVLRDSSLRITHFQSTVQWHHSLHHFRWHLMFTDEMFGFWAAARPWNPIPINS